jgi:hypothetical protein
MPVGRRLVAGTGRRPASPLRCRSRPRRRCRGEPTGHRPGLPIAVRVLMAGAAQKPPEVIYVLTRVPRVGGCCRATRASSASLPATTSAADGRFDRRRPCEPRDPNPIKTGPSASGEASAMSTRSASDEPRRGTVGSPETGEPQRRRLRQAVAGGPVLPRGERERRAEWPFAACTRDGTALECSGRAERRDGERGCSYRSALPDLLIAA